MSQPLNLMLEISVGEVALRLRAACEEVGLARAGADSPVAAAAHARSDGDTHRSGVGLAADPDLADAERRNLWSAFVFVVSVARLEPGDI
jgi:hypothetical protein